MISGLTLLLLLPLVFASPLERRANMVCGKFDSLSYGSYSLLNNLWGMDNTTTGEQCSTLKSVRDQSVKWFTQWTWAEGGHDIKSFSNIQLDEGINQQLSAISSMPWSLTSSGSDLVVADVAYDLFTSYSPGGSNVCEVMIWLANLNAGPISYNYNQYGLAVPVATNLDLAGHAWNLYLGTNGYNKVVSFLPVDGDIKDFSGDIYQFFTYLIDNQYISSWEYLVTAQAGSEATSGSATFTTKAYSLTVN
ncbi:glycoside hydrolase family 12 protein [Imleria badia]|nr:glycoside hydrolase family 12 protein [Imleria badia]